ncbi:hypothetical protein LEP1GSC005_3120 [Leptospira santarosai str. ST188]|nr:hypothetical protein LEP1GSC005_3120 [Leptospira santarosai str. ST188]
MDRNEFKRNRTSFLRSGKIRFRIPSSRTKSNEQTDPNQILIGLILKSSDTYFEDHKQPQSRMTS